MEEEAFFDDPFRDETFFEDAFFAAELDPTLVFSLVFSLVFPAGVDLLLPLGLPTGEYPCLGLAPPPPLPPESATPDEPLPALLFGPLFRAFHRADRGPQVYDQMPHAMKRANIAATMAKSTGHSDMGRFAGVPLVVVMGSVVALPSVVGLGAV